MREISPAVEKLVESSGRTIVIGGADINEHHAGPVGKHNALGAEILAKLAHNCANRANIFSRNHKVTAGAAACRRRGRRVRGRRVEAWFRLAFGGRAGARTKASARSWRGSGFFFALGEFFAFSY